MGKSGFYGENLDIDHLKGSDGLPFLGHTFDYFIDTYKFGKLMHEKYGDVYRCRAFLQRFIVFSSADGVEYILKDEANNFSSKLGWEAFLARLFPNALPTMDGDEHKHHRRIMQHVFKGPILRQYSELINDVVEQDMPSWDGLDEVKIYPTIKSLTLSVAASAFLGLDLADDADFVARTFITVNNGLAPFVPYPVPGLALWRALRAKQRIFNYFRPMIAERRTKEGLDIFTRLCQAKDEDNQSFTDQAILDHLVNILAAAHDTTTTSLTITFYMLLKHPEWQERVREKSISMGKDRLNYEELQDLEELEWVFKEALRIYPPAPNLFRRSLRDCEFNGVHIPANTQVLADCGYVHRSAEYWTNPMAFDPERFSPSRAEDKKHRHQWVPFGGGAHTCIGLHFAMMSAKIILHTLLRRYRFDFADDNDVKFIILPITKPKGGLKVKLTKLL
ncbi:hypothetical protein A9Q99_10955 [Gammaproteobacteria bacterium 45_16_T64]|nr:hypothetical protein A9Q99_10955 [Gammaproteobacteria bacterium 45_16_T64]